MSDYDYYASQLEKLGDAFEYPVTIMLYSEHGKTKCLSLNADSIKALNDFIAKNKLGE